MPSNKTRLINHGIPLLLFTPPSLRNNGADVAVADVGAAEDEAVAEVEAAGAAEIKLDEALLVLLAGFATKQVILGQSADKSDPKTGKPSSSAKCSLSKTDAPLDNSLERRWE